MITLVRVDNRLIHGQVVEAWLPHLKVSRVVVADDEAASSPLIRAAMALAVQSAIEVQILPLAQVDFAALSKDGGAHPGAAAGRGVGALRLRARAGAWTTSTWATCTSAPGAGRCLRPSSWRRRS